MVILVDKHIFVSQTHISFAFEDRIFGVAANNVGAIYQFFIAFTTASIEIGESGGFNSVKPGANDFPIGGGIEGNDTGVAVGAVGFPKIHYLLHGIVGHIVVAIDASIEFGGDISIGSVVSAVHALIGLIDVADIYHAGGNPLLY